jgi:nucleoside-diphosphate-sugar epimerase
MNVFVTGATGYIGHAVVIELVRRGHAVAALARSDESAEKVATLGATAVRGSLTDTAVLGAAAAAADATIHAGATGDAENATVDAGAADALSNALAGTGKRLVYTSGCWLYGTTSGVADEDAPIDPPAIVAWRPAVERRVAATEGAIVTIVRPGVVYGHLLGIPGMLIAGARDGAVPYVGTGDQHWPLVHVHDLAVLYALILEAAAPGNVYNAVSANERVRPIAEAAAAHLGLSKTVSIPLDQARTTMGPFADAIALDQQLSSERAKRELGWKPSAVTVFDDFASSGLGT